jgi:fatty acyl-CoA reductase
VYNSGGHPIKAITLGELTEKGLKLSQEIPMNGIIWNPNVCTIKNQTWYIVNVIFLHLLPGLLIDGLLKLIGRKPM